MSISVEENEGIYDSRIVDGYVIQNDNRCIIVYGFKTIHNDHIIKMTALTLLMRKYPLSTAIDRNNYCSNE